MKWFDIRGFLEASKGWDSKLEKLNNELNDLPYLPAVDNKSGVRSGDISDLTYSVTLKRLKITADIEEILLNKEMLNYAFKRLTEDERELIDGLFYPQKRKSVFVQEYGRKYGLCDTYVYEKKSRVLDKMKRLIEEAYYGEE